MTTIKLGEPGDPYPGGRVVEVRTRDFCSTSVGVWLNYPVDYDFAYTWFHEAEWKAGNRRSVCWARTKLASRPVRSSTWRRLAPALAALTVVVGGLAGCSAGSGPAPPTRCPQPEKTGTATPRATAPAQPRAQVLPAHGRAGADAHHRRRPGPVRAAAHCRDVLRGPVGTVVDGHLLAVDARHVQAQVAQACPAGRVRPGLAGPPGSAAGGSARPARRPRPVRRVRHHRAEPRFLRVLCSQPHSWRAIASYDVAGIGPKQLGYPARMPWSPSRRPAVRRRARDRGRPAHLSVGLRLADPGPVGGRANTACAGRG
ncbi:MAG: hypothetical protein R2734_15400 [Nocardioides sp.]